jgi:hypothetical protein
MGAPGDREVPAQLTDMALAAEVTRKARCADGTVDPDEWFPASTGAEAARREAARAIAICMACPVRGACLELSLRHWTIGQHGVWGGLVAADRAALRRRWLAAPHQYGRAPSTLDRIWDAPPAAVREKRRRVLRRPRQRLATVMTYPAASPAESRSSGHRSLENDVCGLAPDIVWPPSARWTLSRLLRRGGRKG